MLGAAGEEADVAEPPAKRQRTDAEGAEEEGGTSIQERTLSGQLDDDLEALLGAGGLDDDILGMGALGGAGAPVEAPEEAARRAFAEKLAAKERIREDELPDLLETLKGEAQGWGPMRRLRSIALLMVNVARSSRTCRAAFVAQGLPQLGEVLQDAVAHLDGEDAAQRQEAGMRALACLTCLWALPMGRATMWEHRVSVGKPFDRLHRWCGQAKSALGAELRTPTVALCKRWRTQPRPALQETSPEQKGVRLKVVEIIRQGLMGIAGNSPASPALPFASPGVLPPNTTAAEVEAALFGKYRGNTPEYRSHARMLRTNLALAGNAALRTRILTGDLSAEELVALDSAHLAPEALQENRRIQQIEAMNKVIDKQKLESMPSLDRRDSTWNPSTAPLAEGDEEEEEAAKSSSVDMKSSSADAASMPPPPPIATPLPMEPPPTPFQDGHPATPLRGPGDHQAMPMHDVLDTPAQGEEDEQQAELVRWFTQPVP